MLKIISVKKAIAVSKKLKKNNKKIVLTGGCFDILHFGHIKFLEQAKEYGNTLFVFLESDESVRKIKGERRPINSQNKRASILSALDCVNFVIMLPLLEKNEDYAKLITHIKPDAIVATELDPKSSLKEKQARQINADIVFLKRIASQSTSSLASIIGK